MALTATLLALSVATLQAPATFADAAKANGMTLEIIDRPYSWQGNGYKVEAQAPEPEALKKYEKLFVEEWNRYPASLFKKARVTKLIIASRLTLLGQVRAAVPAFEADTMYYDAELGNYRPDYQRVVIHHELFHMFDQRMGRMLRDPEWAALNPPGFKYGDGGDKVRNLGAGELTDKLVGLLTPYAASAIEEDKAELFAHLLVNPKFVADRAGKDPVLAKKIELLKRRMAEYDPNMGESFWRPLADKSAVVWSG